MKLKTFLKSSKEVSAFAKKIGVDRNVVYQWINGIRPVPIVRCKSVVVATNYKVNFADLRPDDWFLIWDDKLPRKENTHE